MNKRYTLMAIPAVIVAGLIAVGVGFWVGPESNQDQANITNFEQCIAANNLVMESYPRQCSAGGQTFTEELDKKEQLLVMTLSESKYLSDYEIDDTGYGTKVTVVVDATAKTRAVESNALPNHETGEFPNPGNPNTISAQSKSWTFTTNPVKKTTKTEVKETGVAINGVKFDPGTAEVATCDGGKTERIEAIQDVTDLGLDFNNAHVQPNGEYHYHGASNTLAEAFNTDGDLVHIGFAADGFLIYRSKSDAVKPSYQISSGDREGVNCNYSRPSIEPIEFSAKKDGALTSDWEYNAESGHLDECNGATIDGQYIYLITDDYPFVPRCLMGEATNTDPGGPPPR